MRIPRVRTSAPVLYFPLGSAVHRLPAGLKFTSLAIFLVLSATLAKTPVAATACLIPVLVCYAVARIPLRHALSRLVPVLVILAGLSLLTWWRKDFPAALTAFFVLLAAVSAAILLTMTTKVSDLQHSVETALRPAAALGVPVEKISLALSLTVHFIPLQLHLVSEVLDAQRARGVGFSARALGIPLTVRTLVRGHELGEALQARGAGD